MNDSVKGYILVGLAILLGVGAYVLYAGATDFHGYWYICAAGAVVALGFGLKFVFDNSNPTRAYESNVRNIIYVETIDDLIDAQLEIRKPICYYKQTESCSFALLDDKEAYIYIEKLNPDVVSPLEIEIKENKLKIKSADEMDSEMLRDIEKTTIVKLSNKKSYKVSPIRKDKKKEEEKQEEIKEEKEEIKEEKKNSFTPSDEIEIL